VSTRCSTPCVRCSRVGHMFPIESGTSVSNGYLRTTRHGQVSTERVWYSPDPCAESSANRDLTGLRAPDASGTHRTYVQRGLQNALTLDAHHRMHPECPVLSVKHPLLKSGHTGRMNSEHAASGAVRPVLNPNRAKH